MCMLVACDDGADDGARDAAADGGDAAQAADAQPLDGTVVDRDTGAADAETANDAGPDAAAPDAEAASRRAQICGESTNFPSPLPPMAQRKAQPVGSATFGFLEGPVWIAEQGVLLFSDMNFSASPAPNGPPGAIRKLTPPATYDASPFVAMSNCNGLALDEQDRLLAATHDTQALARFALTGGARSDIPVLSDGKRLNSPNDLTVRSDGTVYFTDPDWQLGPRENQTKRTGVYRLAPPLSATANAALLVDGRLNKPNGITLSPDEQTLYVGSMDREIWKYPVQADGSLGERSKFAEPGGSDGMAVDCAGNLYVTSGSVQVFDPEGNKLGELMLEGSTSGPSNVAFGGADRKTLYITAGPRLYSIALNVPGFPY